MSDLVEKLRLKTYTPIEDVEVMIEQAADRIEALEAELEQWSAVKVKRIEALEAALREAESEAAADSARVEALEAALREVITKIPRNYLTTKPEEMAYRARCHDALDIARRALEGKHE